MEKWTETCGPFAVFILTHTHLPPQDQCICRPNFPPESPPNRPRRISSVRFSKRLAAATTSFSS